MRIRLRGTAIEPEQQRENDRPFRASTLWAFFALALAYAYLLTHLGSDLGLPAPEQVFRYPAQWISYTFDDDGNINSQLYVDSVTGYDYDDARLILLGVISAAFVCSYLLPLQYKQPALVFWFLVGFTVFYGSADTAMLLAAHLSVYLCLHGPFRRSNLPALLVGPLLFWAGQPADLSVPGQVFGLILSGLTSLTVCRILVFRGLGGEGVVAGWVRRLIPHIAMLTVYAGIVANGLTESVWTFGFGLLFFLFQWARLIVYSIDYHEGSVPRDLRIWDYLSIFLSPATIANHHYAPYAAQGYSYLASKYLCRDKNAIIVDGLTLWAIALMYLVFGRWAVYGFVDYAEESWQIPVYAYISQMIDDYVAGTRMSTPTVLLSTLLDQINVFLLWGAVLHFKVGTWRVFAYDVDPQYNRPWLATNLATLWGRFAFHYREFLVRVLYYPVFFRCAKQPVAVRVFAAIMIATVLGNPFWGHTPAKLLYEGLTWDNFFQLILRSWPYYVLLGLGISLSQLYLMKRVRTRKPWTADKRLGLDILCCYLTFQYFSLIHIFIRPREDSVLMDHVRLFLIGLGIHL